MQFLKHGRILPESYQVVRPVSISMIAMAVVACAMAIKGWQITSTVLGSVIVLIAAAMIYQVHRAVSHLHNQSDTLRQAARQAEKHYIDVLRRIIRFTETRDRYTVGRSERIGRLTELMARRLAFPEEKCALMGLAGQLHDIGLIAIPEDILNKRTKLDRHEFHTVQKHCEIAYEMLLPLESLREVLPAIRYHHERMNGTGYPAARRGMEIPMEARLLAVADAYDAMTHDRPHRPAMMSLDAMDELRRCSPAGFDPQCVEALADVIHLPELQDAMQPAAKEAGMTQQPMTNDQLIPNTSI